MAHRMEPHQIPPRIQFSRQDSWSVRLLHVTSIYEHGVQVYTTLEYPHWPCKNGESSRVGTVGADPRDCFI